MIKPPIPVDELLRLETLRKLKVLDTNPEERFDRVTRLAKRLFGTPIALVSLVDAERQWFKSHQGLEATETPRDISFCGHAILEDEILVVGDAHDDERFHDNPLVTSNPSIRFYAGYPLTAPNGSKVGTLCVIDDKPRDLRPDDLQLLRELGEMIEDELVIAEMVRNDPVTGLSNRAGFCAIAQHLLAMCRRTKASASIALLHLANQHVIEASMGGTDSDRAAVELAQLSLASFRNSDIVARLSGDTFVVLLAGSGLPDIDKALRRLEERVAQRNAANVDYELEIDSYTLEYRPDDHGEVETLLKDLEAQMSDGNVGELVYESSAETG